MFPDSTTYSKCRAETPSEGKIKRISTREFSSIIVTRQRIKYLWSRARNYAKVLGRLKKINKDILLFGSKTLRNETQEIKSSKIKIPKCMILHTSSFRVLWDLLLLAITLCIAIVLPYFLCFGVTLNNWIYAELTFNLFFMIDTFSNFFTTYKDKSGKLVFSRGSIAKNYLKSWFFFDFLSSLPYEIIDLSSNNSSGFNSFFKFFRVGKISKFIRAFRLLKIIKLLKLNLSEYFLLYSRLPETFFKVVIFLSALLISVHVLGCLWYYIGDDIGTNNWIFYFQIKENDDFDRYLISVYYVFTTVTTVGYGDIYPINNGEKIYSIFLMVYGVVIYSYILSGLSEHIRLKQKRLAEFKEKINGYRDFARHINMPNKVFQRMKNNLKFYFKNNAHVKQKQLLVLRDIPFDLREEVFEFINKRYVNGVCFFEDKSRRFLNNFVPFLKTSIFAANDTVYKINDLPEEVYFIKAGRVYLTAANKLTFRIYVQGSYFGEIEIFENTRRDCECVVGKNEVELLVMKQKDFLRILSDFPEEKQQMIATAKIKKTKNTESKHKVLDLLMLDEDNSLITESESSEVSINENGLVRQDTGVLVSIQNESAVKKSFRKIWSTALKQDPKKSIFHRTKTMIKSSFKKRISRSYSRLKLDQTDSNVYSKRRSLSGEILNISSLPDELKIDIKRLKEISNDYINRLQLQDLSLDSVCTPVAKEKVKWDFSSNPDHVMTGSKIINNKVSNAISEIDAAIYHNLHTSESLENLISKLDCVANCLN